MTSNDLHSLRQRYDAAFEAWQLIVTRNAQRFATRGASPRAEDCKGEADARAALEAARAALVAALDPSEPQSPEIDPLVRAACSLVEP